ncbi:hypothetical protein KCU98_g985, partial [Aureobasidium melanogenum]
MLPIKTLALRWGWIPLLLIPLIIVGSYELAIHFPIHHKQHTSHLSEISFPNATVLTAQRTFPGFSIWQPTELDELNLSESCQTALTRKILCEDTVQGYDGPAWRGSIEDKELYDEVCDASCGASLRSYYQDVSQACAGYNMTGAPPTMDGGYMWEAWNETCYIEPQSGRYCNEIIDGFTEVEDIYHMPHNELCSYCYTKFYQMLQASQYSAFDATHDPYSIEHINKHCKLHIPTEAPPPLIPSKAPEEPFCLSNVYHTTEEGDTCTSISKTYNVSSYALFEANKENIYGPCQNTNAIPPGRKFCIPLLCDIYEIQPDDLCITIQYSQNIRGYGVSLRTYNAWINPSCSTLQAVAQNTGSIVCVSPQGGRSTDVSRLPRTRGGNVVPYPATGNTVDAKFPPQGTKLAQGTTRNCGKWHRVEENDSCATICMREKIDVALLVATNPSLERGSCSAGLVVGTTLCVGPSGTWGSEMDDYYENELDDYFKDLEEGWLPASI